MLSKQINECESITKLNQESQNQRLRLFAKVDITTKLKILSLQKKLFHKLKKEYLEVNNDLLTLSSLLLAIGSFAKEIDDINFNAIKLRGKNNKLKAKRQKLLGYWAIVRTLRLEQNMSFRDIATYFVKYHKFEISYSLVYQVWIELENNIKNKEE